MSVPSSQQYNLRSPAVKRILREAAELSEPTYEYYAQPLEDNIFEWHFTVRGADETDFTNGLYHGRIVLPNDYPMKPPSIILLTPNGRFEVNKKICLSISGYHPETWQPCWSIRTVLMAIISFMPTKSEGAIGSLDYTPQERKKLALRSHRWTCPDCGPIVEMLKDNKSLVAETESEKTLAVKSREDAEFADFMAKVSFQSEKQASNNNDEKVTTQESNSETVNKTLTLETSQNEVSSSTSVETSVDEQSDEVQTSNSISTIEASSQPEPVINETLTPPSRTSTPSSRLQATSNSFLHSSFINYFLGAIFTLIVAIFLRRLFKYIHAA